MVTNLVALVVGLVVGARWNLAVNGVVAKVVKLVKVGYNKIKS